MKIKNINGNSNSYFPISDGLSVDRNIAMRFRDIHADFYANVPDPNLAPSSGRKSC